MKTSRWQVLKAWTRAKWRLGVGCPQGWQDRQVTRHLQRVLKTSAWYRKKFAGLEISRWRDWPVIDKAEMMANFDELNTVGVAKSEALALARRAEESRDFSPQIGDITVGLSSGTTGNSGIFLADSKERAEWAGNLLAKVLPRSLFRPQKVALFLRANSTLYESTRSRTIQFRFFDLLNAIDDHVARLNVYQPDIIVAPPSMLRLLAARLDDGTLTHLPGKIISAAEKLDQLDEGIITKAFKQMVHQVYQCTEGFLATTCRHGTLHVNEDVVVMQRDYLDRDSGRFAPIITDFRRISQPIIRYRLDDILVERKEPCPCGLPWLALQEIEGRCDDLCFLRPSHDSGASVAVFPDFIRRAVISADSGIVDYTVRQTGAGTFVVALVGRQGPDVERRVREGLHERFRSLGGRPAEIRFEKMRPRKTDAKQRRVLRECPLPKDLT